LILGRAVAKAAHRSKGENEIQVQPQDLTLVDDELHNPVGFIWDR